MSIKNLLIKYKIIIISALIIILGVTTFFIKQGDHDSNPIVVDAFETKCQNNDDDSTIETYSVDVKGAIKKPGVYKVEKGSNVNDVIELAGGLKSNGITTNINLSKKVYDEMVIYIYTKNEFNKLNNVNDNKKVVETNECKTNSSSADITSCLTNSKDSIITSSDLPNYDDNVSESNNGLVNINKATKEQLLTLTGIGESKADSIINYRQEHGQFNCIDDIKNVLGIGETLFEKIKNNITV